MKISYIYYLRKPDTVMDDGPYYLPELCLRLARMGHGNEYTVICYEKTGEKKK